MPPQPTDCRDAIHWFVDNFALYTGSVRGLLISDFTQDYEAYIESAVINLRARGIEPFLLQGDQIFMQAQNLWQQAVGKTPFGQPAASNLELDMLSAEVVIIKDLDAPVTPHQLWYLFHYVLYMRALFGKATVITTQLGLDEFIAYGADCEDMEYAGRKITWEKVMWLMDATMIDLYQFRQVKTEGHPPMLKTEYNLFNAIRERELPVVAQQILGDYMLDMSIADRDNRLAIEVDVLASLDPDQPNSAEAKKNLVLLSDGWKILRFTAAEILGDLTICVDAIEQVWTGGRKKAAVGRLLSGREQAKVPELPVDDDVQKMSITHGPGPVAVTGAAGTGKTSCVTHRIGYLVAQGVNPERILVFSHTDETVKQLKRQVEVLTDGQTAQRINFSNWRDLGLRILKENATAIKRKAPLKVETSPQRVLQRVLKKELKDQDQLRMELMDAEFDEINMANLIALYKANLITPEIVKARSNTDVDDIVATIYSAYEEQLRKANKVDPDDMITLCAQLLADDADVRQKYQYRFDYVLVDEYQECTAACDLMARLLAYPQDNLFLAGDEDECVSEGKGALPRALADASIRMPNARCYVLEKNWRSHPAIVDHSRSLAAAMEVKTIAKDMMPGFGQAATSAVIGPQQSKSEEAEADWVANEVSILIESGKAPGDIVILWRNPRYATLLETALFKRNIRCMASGASADAVPDETGDVMAFLRLVMDPDGPKARESFERFCQLKSREMDQKLSKLSNTIASFAEANNLSFLKAIEIYHDATADSSCEDLAQLVRIVRTMNQENLPPSQTIGLLKRTQRLNEIYSAVKVPQGVVYEPMRKVEQLEEEAKGYTTVREFVKAKQKLAESPDPGKEDSSVIIKSFEDSKGDEFPIVFLTGMAEGLVPAEIGDHEEERRLAYVAITRGKELLYISYPAKFEDKPLPPSPFLVEARLLPINVYKKAVELIRHEPIPRKTTEQAVPPAVQTAQPAYPGTSGGNQQSTPPAASSQQSGAYPAQGGQTQSGAQKPPAGGRPGGKPPSDYDLLMRETRLGAVGPKKDPFVGPQADQARLDLEARQKIEHEEKLKAQYAAHLEAQQKAQEEAHLEAQKRIQQEAHLRNLHEQQLRAQQEAAQLAQKEQLRKQAEEEAQRRVEQEARLKARQEAELRAQQEAEAQAEAEAAQRAEQEALMRAQQQAAQEAARLAQEQALLRIQQEAQAQLEQEAALQAQQEAAARAQQEAALLAQQQAAQLAAQQAAQQVQQEAAARAQQEAAMLAQQEAAVRAQQEAAMRAQQEAAALAEQQASILAQQEAVMRAQQEAEALAEQQAAMLAQQEAAARAQQEAAMLAEQEEALKAQQAAELRAQQEAAFQAEMEAVMRMAAMEALAVEEAPAQQQPIPAQPAQEDIRKLVDEQFNFGAGIASAAPAAAPQMQPVPAAQPPVAEQPPVLEAPQEPVAEVDPERVKAEEVVRSNKEILDEMDPEEREKQQVILRKKAREKLKGRKKKDAQAEDGAEPTLELAPAAPDEPPARGRRGRKVAPPAEETAPEVVAPPVPAPPAVDIPTPVVAPSAPPAEPLRPAAEMNRTEIPSPDPANVNWEPTSIPFSTPMNRVAPEPKEELELKSGGTIVWEMDATPAAPAVEVPQPMAEVQQPALQVPQPAMQLPAQPAMEMPTQQALVNSESSGANTHNEHQAIIGGSSPPGVTVHKAPASAAIPDLEQFLSSSDNKPFADSSTAPVTPTAVPSEGEWNNNSQPNNYNNNQQPYVPPQQPTLPPAPQFSPPPYVPPPQQYVPPPQDVPANPLPPHPMADAPAPQISPVRATGGLPFCPQCNAALEANARFCGECGLHLTVRIQACPGCQLPLEPNSKFCGECGYSLK